MRRWHLLPVRRRSCTTAALLRAVAALLLLPCSGRLTAQQAASAPPANAIGRFDGRAIQLLQQMADAYAHLPALNQRTVFYSAMIPMHLAPDRRSYLPTLSPKAPADPIDAAASGVVDPKLAREVRLQEQQPNRLRMEMREPDPDHSGSQRLSLWVSDGRTFWTYSQEKHYYTKEKAPSRMRGFQKMANLTTGGLELMMLIGVNPFVGIREKADNILSEGRQTVRGVETDVVMMETSTPGNITRARFYIGHDDQLLHRLTVETTPRVLGVTRSPGKVGDELDALVDDSPSAPAPPAAPPKDEETSSLPMLSRLTYDNLLEPSSQLNALDFAFKAPSDASLYAPFDLRHPIKSVLTKGGGKIVDTRHASKQRVVRP